MVSPPSSGKLTGFNVRWNDMPFLSSKVLTAIKSLKPAILRYPGGTVAHSWDWRTGLLNNGNGAGVAHKISDVKVMADGTDAAIIFVLDVVNKSLTDQVEMLTAANMPIQYIELGNELYSPDYASTFPDGKSYADTVNRWAPVLKTKFPGVKIGAVMSPRKVNSSNKRLYQWNNLVISNVNKAYIDAFIYHLYVDEDESVDERKTDFETVYISNTGEETWITEYGARSYNLAQSIELAKYVESISEIAMNHCLIVGTGNDFSKFTSAFDLTDEGTVFKAKAVAGNSFYKETFEKPTGTSTVLNKVMGFKSLSNGQTTGSSANIQYVSLAGQNAFPADNNINNFSNNGLLLSYNSGQVSSQYGKIDNLVVTPVLEKDGSSINVSIDVAYSYKQYNTASVTFYWSDTYKGGTEFNEAEWKPMATVTADLLNAEGYAENRFCRKQFTINPTASFYLAVRVQQQVNATAWQTQWKFDNIIVTGN